MGILDCKNKSLEDIAIATKDLIASITLTLIFVLFISELFGMSSEKDGEIDDKEMNRKKILDEVNLVLSKYSM